MKKNNPKLSRRQFLNATLAAGAATAAGRAFSAAPAAQPLPGTTRDLVLVNGRIHTMDARNTVAGSVVIRNGKIAAVNADPRRGATASDAEVIDLRNRTVIPGLIETHLHGLDTADRVGYHTLELESAGTIRGVQEELARQRKTVPEGQWITAIGAANTNLWAEHRFPTLKELDDAVPDRPVLLY